MAKTNVTISGNLSVKTTRTPPTGATLPLAVRLPLSRVQVFVEGRRGKGIWNNIGQAETDAAGNFTINHHERVRDRRYRIQVRFKCDDLVVRNKAAAGWETVLEQSRVVGEDLTGVNIVFGDRSASSSDTVAAVGGTELSENAEVWALTRLLLDLLDEIGEAFAGRLIRPFRVEMVTFAKIETFADPVLRNVHLLPGETIRNIFHEPMHIWAYDHTRSIAGGQLRLAGSAASGLTTHEVNEARTTAFHEGFAEYAAKQVEQRIFNTPRPLPLSRRGIADIGLTSTDDMLHNDDSWESILTTLSTSGLRELAFGTSTSPGVFVTPVVPPPAFTVLAPFVGFERMLGCFARAGAVGEHLRLGSGEMRRLQDFLERIEAIVGGAMKGRVDEYLRLFDPNESVEPAALFA
jgi:hypothetical protein